MMEKMILLVMGIFMGGEMLSAHATLDMDPYEVRNVINEKCMSIDASVPEVYSTREIVITTAGGYDTPIRIYTPSDEVDLPLILFIHGGAWVAGNLDTHDNLARYICVNANAVVLSVGYLNAPEGKFPVSMQQCYDSLLWAKDHTQGLGIDHRIAVVGDSAGGNMAAVLCQMARDFQGPEICFQVFINPAPDLSCGGTLTQQGNKLDILRWQAMMYVQDPEDVYNPYVSPSLAEDFTGLPSALILLAEFDDLRQDGQGYAEKLRAAQVPTQVYCQMGVNHLGGHGARASEMATESLDFAANALRDIFDTSKLIEIK